MSVIAGLQDFAQRGPPADIGTYVLPATVVVLPFTFGGTVYYVAVRSGDRGWVLVDIGTVPETVINNALALGAGTKVVLLDATYNTVAGITIPTDCELEGMGSGTVINFNAGGHAIELTGNNARVKNLKVTIVAGAGGAGTRPNCVYADDVSNLLISGIWAVGDTTVADDGNDGRQNGVCLDTVTNSKVELCKCTDNRRYGIVLIVTSTDNIISLNHCHDNVIDGFRAGSDCNYNTITGNICYSNTRHGLATNGGDHNTYSGNVAYGNTQNGLRLKNALGNTWSNNISRANTRHGLFVEGTSTYNTISGNVCYDNDSGGTATYDGINITETSTDNDVIGNFVYNNDRIGIRTVCARTNIVGNNVISSGENGIFVDATDCNVQTNFVYINGQNDSGTHNQIQIDNGGHRALVSNNQVVSDGASSEDGIRANQSDNVSIVGNYCYDHMGSGIAIQWNNDNNMVIGNYCINNDDYGIEIMNTNCTETWVENNYFSGNVTGAFSDSGTDTRLPTLKLQFVGGTDLRAYTDPPWGWDIDAAAENAYAFGHLPLKVQQVVRWKIWAVSIVTEADAMRLEISGYGGASNEPYTTETVAVTNKPSTTTNFAANDVIYWVLDSSDDTDIDDMVGGDTVMIGVLHEVAGNGDCATDAVFQCVEIEYV